MSIRHRTDRVVSGSEVDVDLVAAAAAGCPAVAALSAGMFGEVATYLPGRKVGGIRVTDTDVEIHIVAHHGHPLHHVAAHLGALTRPLIGHRRLTVAVDDLDVDLPSSNRADRSITSRSGSEQP